MKEWIIEADDESVYYMFKRYEAVTRCKDCKFNKDSVCTLHCGSNYIWVVKDEDYCSAGKRRDAVNDNV